MKNWTYDLNVPDDAPDVELEGYRELAIATWRTGAESVGGSPGEADAILVDIEPTSGRAMGEPATFSRAWRITGAVR